jgi:hypothetical protein
VAAVEAQPAAVAVAAVTGAASQAKIQVAAHQTSHTLNSSSTRPTRLPLAQVEQELQQTQSVALTATTQSLQLSRLLAVVEAAP